MFLNNNSFRRVGALGLIMVAAGAAHAGSLAPTKVQGDARSIEAGRRLLAERSARFIENKGQWAKEARFLAKSAGLNLWYTDHGIRFDQVSSSKQRHQAIDMFFVGGQVAHPVGILKTNARLDIYHGKSAVKNIGSYRELITKNVLPGVSMRGYFDAGHPRYDLMIAPGANPSKVRIGFHGNNDISVQRGILKIGTQLGGFFNGKPYAYQTVAGKRMPVDARWCVLKDGTARFSVGKYDASRTLVIDPLVYGTYFGGEQDPDEIRAAMTDTYGGGNSLVIVGSSSAPDYPATSRPFTDTLNPEGTDAFIARIVPAGDATDFSVLVGGQGTDIAQYLKVDPNTGDLWFAGTTTTPPGQSASFPALITTSPTGATSQENVIGSNASASTEVTNFFVGRFTHLTNGTLSFGDVASSTTSNPRTAVIFGTGLAAFSGQPRISLTGFDLARRSTTGDLQFALTGVTDSMLPTAFVSGTDTGTASVYTFPNHHAGFIVRFNYGAITQGSSFRQFNVRRNVSQYITGLNTNEVRGVALDTLGNAYVAGTVFEGTLQNVDTSARPDIFYTTPTSFDANGTTALPRILRSTDVFVRIYGDYYSAQGTSAITYSALLGGNGDDQAGGAAASLQVVRVGDYPNGPNPPTPQYASIPIYTGSAIAIDGDQNIYITGTTRGTDNFPHTSGSFGGFTPPQGSLSGAGSDVFVARLQHGGTRLDYAATLAVFARQTPVTNTEDGGLINNVFSADAIPTIPTTAIPAGIAVDTQGYVYVTGNLRPYSIVFPETAGTPNEPTSSSPSTIQLTTGANAALNTDYGTPSAGPFPSTEGFLTVIQPDFSKLQLSTYIGGSLDDLIFAPSFDSAGHVLIMGSTDGGRQYRPAGSTNSPYMAFSGLPGLISNVRVKSDPDSERRFTQSIGYGVWKTMGSNTPAMENFSFGRDGFISAIDAGVPVPKPVSLTLAFSPTSINPLGSSTGTVTLGTTRSVDTRVEVDLATGYPGRVSVSYTDAVTNAKVNNRVFDPRFDAQPFRFYVTIPSGSSSATFSVNSLYYGSGLSTSFVAYQVTTDGTNTRVGSVTNTASVTINPLAFTLALSNPTLKSGASTETATITLSSPTTLPTSTSLTFSVTVPNTSANQTLFPNSTLIANNLLLVTTVTVMAPASGGTPYGTSNSFRVNGSTNGSTILTAMLTNPAPVFDDSVTATTTLSVTPPAVLSISPSTSLVRSSTNSAVTFTITFDSQPSAGYAVSFSVLSSSVFPSLATATFSDLVPTSNPKVFTITRTPVRVSRTQDVSITVNGGGTSASTSVTVIR